MGCVDDACGCVVNATQETGDRRSRSSSSSSLKGGDFFCLLAFPMRETHTQLTQHSPYNTTNRACRFPSTRSRCPAVSLFLPGAFKLHAPTNLSSLLLFLLLSRLACPRPPLQEQQQQRQQIVLFLLFLRLFLPALRPFRPILRSPRARPGPLHYPQRLHPTAMPTHVASC